jgi:amidophosphoribosyltransferase
VNHVRRLYDRYEDEQISRKIGELVYPKDISWKGDLDIVFLPVDKMRAALPTNNGDWYFTGNYPTPGGFAALNKAYINFFENKDGRAY